MFGKPSQNAPNPSSQPKTSDMAQIQGGGLVQLIVTSVTPLNFFLFLSDKPVAEIDVESVSISVEAPDNNLGDPIVRATLARYVTGVSGERALQRAELFPCTIEVVAVGRRLSITCMNPDSLDNLWIDVGLKPDGTSNELQGLKSLRFLLTEGILDGKVTFVDGVAEDLFPQ